MSDLLTGALTVLLATNQPVALSNFVHQRSGLSVKVPDRNDPVEVEYRKLLVEDDAAQAEVDRWIKENQKFEGVGGGMDAASLNGRIKQRLDKVRKAYEDFLRRHPNHSSAHLAYGSFLTDLGEEEAAEPHLHKSVELDPTNAAAWNNLANHCGHNGAVTNSFKYYEKAISLAPRESLYYHNFATTVYMFRYDATNYFGITEQQVFDKSMGLYRRALELDPTNFLLATDFAQSYYGFKPRKTGNAEADRKAEEKHFNEAIRAWQQALKLARDDIERQGVLIHFARLQINAHRFTDAAANLDAVTDPMFDRTKGNLRKKLASEQEKASGTATSTNAPVRPKP